MRFFWQGLLPDGDKTMSSTGNSAGTASNFQDFFLGWFFFLGYLNSNFWRQILTQKSVNKLLAVFSFSKLSNWNLPSILTMHPHKHVYCRDGWNIFLFFFNFYTPLEWTGNLFFSRVLSTRIDRCKRSMESGPLSQLFFNRDNLANVGTSERKLTGNAKIEQQEECVSYFPLFRDERRKKNSFDRMLLASSSLLLCIRSLTTDKFPPLAFPLPIVA
jgi:hypothetical protein